MRWRYFLWVGMLLALDQISKHWARTALAEGQTVALIPGAVEFTLVYNTGVAFGMLRNLGLWFSPVALLVAIAVTVCYMRAPERDRAFRAAMVLVCAGALGNLVDRVANSGRVTDFVDIKIIHVFNLADACISAGVLLLLVKWLGEAFGGRAREGDQPVS